MNPDDSRRDATNLVPTGIEGLDEIPCGGLTPHGLYLVEGDPGSGKTTLALQFMLEGVKRGERCMFVTLAEEERSCAPPRNLTAGRSTGIHIFEILASEESLKPDARYTMYHPSEVELAETTKAVLAEAARIKPDRLVLDSLSEFRMLAESPAALSTADPCPQAIFRAPANHIAVPRRSDGRISRYAAAQQRTGRDQPRAANAGVRLDTAAVAGQQDAGPPVQRGPSRFRHPQRRTAGVSTIDRCRAQGPVRTRGDRERHRSSSTRYWVAGSRKARARFSSAPPAPESPRLRSQFAVAAAKRGEHPVLYLFDESVATSMERSAGFGHGRRGPGARRPDERAASGPRRASPGEFAHAMRVSVEKENTQMVVIDSLNGYLNATPSERFLTLHIHELLTYPRPERSDHVAPDDAAWDGRRRCLRYRWMRATSPMP